MPGNVNNSMPPSGTQAIDIDVVFLHDCTESQQPYIESVRKYIKDAIPMIKSEANLKGGSARYRVIAFRDHKEQDCDWLLKQFDFTSDPSVIANQLAGLVASGGGDGPEAQIDGLDAARRSPWRQTAKRIVILITDSPPHGVGEPGDSVPKDHPKALTDVIVLKTYQRLNIQLNVLACVPEITYYETAERFYQNLTKSTSYGSPIRIFNHELITLFSGLYIPLPEPRIKPEAMKYAVVGCILHSTNSLRTTERWEKWIMDQSDRGQEAIVNDIHSKLSQEGEKCHKVNCTEHSGVSDVSYSLQNVDRDFVDSIVSKTLRFNKDIKENPHLYDEHH